MCVISRQYRELDGITTHEQTSTKATGRSFESSKGLGLGRSSSSSFSFPPSFPPLERKKVKTWKRTRALKRSQKGGTYERERERIYGNGPILILPFRMELLVVSADCLCTCWRIRRRRRSHFGKKKEKVLSFLNNNHFRFLFWKEKEKKVHI